MHRFRHTTSKAVLGVTLAALCGAAGLATSAQAQEQKASVRFSWKLKGEYAPFYVAMNKGYFAEQGIDISLGEGAGAQSALGAVEQGQETATYAPGIHGLQAISKGVDVKLVALYHPETPMAIVSHPDNPVNEPKDLEGQSFAHSPGDTGADFLPVFCNINNIDCDTIEMVQLSYKAVVPSFLNKDFDSTTMYRTNDIPALRAKGVELVVMDFPEYGLSVPGGSLIVSNDTIENDPDVVRGLIDALNKGVQFAKDDPMAAAKIMKQYWDTTLSDEVVAEQVMEMVQAVPERSGKPLGWIDPDTLKRSLEQMKAAGKIDEIFELDRYYTNELN